MSGTAPAEEKTEPELQDLAFSGEISANPPSPSQVASLMCLFNCHSAFFYITAELTNPIGHRIIIITVHFCIAALLGVDIIISIVILIRDLLSETFI